MEVAYADSGRKIVSEMVCTTILSYNLAKSNFDDFLIFYWKFQLESNTLCLFFKTLETVIFNAGKMNPCLSFYYF